MVLVKGVVQLSLIELERVGQPWGKLLEIGCLGIAVPSNFLITRLCLFASLVRIEFGFRVFEI